MFERFTDRARRVMVLAQEEARMLNHSYIGTEHLLLGLIHEGEGVASKALESLGISLGAIRQQVEQIIGRGQQMPSGHIPFTPRAKKVLELSLREARQLGHSYVGTEHLLLGLIREGDGVGAQVLVKMGGDLDRVRQQVILLGTGHRDTPAGNIPVPPLSRDPMRGGDILSRLDSIDRRLAAIGQLLGIGGEAPGLRRYDEQIAQIRRHKEAAVDAQDFEAAADLRAREHQLLTERAAVERDWKAAGHRAPGGDTDVTVSGEEAGRLRGEIRRLRALLREHDIDPGEETGT